MRPHPQETAYLVTFTEEILNGKLHFLRSEISERDSWYIPSWELYVPSQQWKKQKNVRNLLTKLTIMKSEIVKKFLCFQF